MSRRFILALACLLLLAGKAAAGWYHVENYVGFLGPDPIHFSIQTFDGFGSGITTEGSYFYDEKQSPVAIYGIAIGTRLTLCEISDDRQFDRIIRPGPKTPVDTSGCPISLDINDAGATGTWRKGAIEYPVTLRKVAMLDDTGKPRLDGIVEIPFWAQTATHRFSGIYTDTGICMQRLEIINKASGKVDQEIDLKDDICNAGTLTNAIYFNVQNDVDGDVAMIFVCFSDNSGGHMVEYIFNPKTKMYEAGETHRY